MAELKTQPTNASVVAFLGQIENETKRKDSFRIHELMKTITGEEPVLWGESIIGFGNYHYKYNTGREGDWFITGFSPRKQSLTIYLMSGFSHCGALLSKLGKHKTSKSCLYINKLEDIDMDVLEQLIRESVNYIKNKK